MDIVLFAGILLLTIYIGRIHQRVKRIEGWKRREIARNEPYG